MEIRNIREEDFLDCVNIVKKSWPEFKERESIYHLFSKYFSDISFVIEQDFQIVAFLFGFRIQSFMSNRNGPNILYSRIL